MACINKHEPINTRVKYKTIHKIKDECYVPEQAYLVPDNEGTSIYLSYELNKTLEIIFRNYSINGYMGVNEFIRMCYDYNLLPRKKNKEVLYYIFKSSNSLNTGCIEYKYFFQILQRLSSYLFRKLVMTEEEKFNVLIKHLTSIKVSQKTPHVERYNAGVQVDIKRECKEINAVCEMIDASCDAFVDVKSIGIATDEIKYENNKRTELHDENKESHNNALLNEKKNDNKQNNNNNNSSSERKLQNSEKLKIKKRIESIEKAYTHKDELNKKLKEELNSSLKIIEEKNVEIENINKNNLKELEKKDEKIEDLKKIIEQLKSEKKNLELKESKTNIQSSENNSSKQLPSRDKLQDIEMDYLNLKRVVVLPCEEEAQLLKIFAMYSTYCGGTVEYVMNKTLCANFLTRSYLLRQHEKNNTKVNLDIKNAEILFNKVIYKRWTIEQNEMLEDVLTYFYFKILLSDIGKYLYPELGERESFLEIVLNHVLVVKRHGHYAEKKENKSPPKNIPKIKPSYSDDLNMFKDNIVGGYTSSEKEHTKNQTNQDKKRNEVNNNRKSLKLKKKKEKIINNTDQSFEYILSNETKKKTDKMNGKKNKNKENKISDNNNKHINQLKGKILYRNMYGYDTSNDENKSFCFSTYENFNLALKKNDFIKPTKIKSKFLENPINTKRSFTNINTKKKNNFKSEFPLYDIEGELWELNSDSKKCLPSFGKY
ncbi:conserved Plasmodium protein, unknown function [Plasmodium yoelii]|uniref:Uncharacterized protein n=3 Tax=Plasmodium yoelii TaxID=5861 RepID=A0AAE9WZ99_PLAYO|nr:conserved Plasmodium protein, unknown function [Plasmodium yoelii]WBY60984.1 hypothetical protein Py17XNL_001401222 [Plasmodium yoelii yoelii]CDU20735.1 conserved Plasmodium protein, unknown function [Plasmodium yoelii]VTZ81698.1 conserved Plasmodium protein, unknown function [Plasmodium yoelii]|eukprot:XP_022812956.1 conserved Plasmodium protein, unknown function [Plasmodium yoelii]